MIDIEVYIAQLIRLLKKQFGSRLIYVGLQGSYLRAEATPDSDIDIMVVVDALSVSDLGCYRTAIESLGNFEKSCGFICSKADLLDWNPLEICHLLNSTKDYYGQLQALIPIYTEQDIRNFVKLSVNNLYHEICHRYVHGNIEENMECLPGSYNGVFFTLQNLFYLSSGQFVLTKSALLPLLEGKNHDVLARSIELNRGKSFDFAESFELLFTWCQETLSSL